MIDLILCIISSVLLVLIFRVFGMYRIDNLQAIVVNYFVASGLGMLVFQKIPGPEIIEKQWFGIALLLGMLFITFFNVLAISTQKVGVSITSVAFKMAVIMPVIAAFVLYDDEISFLKIAGIFSALIGIYLASKPEKTKEAAKSLFWPLLLFIGSGIIDTLFNYAQVKFVPRTEYSFFAACLFLIAGIAGSIGVIVQLMLGKKKLEGKNIIAGIILGIPNFGAVYFLLRALDVSGLESSVIYPINNIAIVAVSSLCGWLFFKERLSNYNWIGVLLSIISIAIIAIG